MKRRTFIAILASVIPSLYALRRNVISEEYDVKTYSLFDPNSDYGKIYEFNGESNEQDLNEIMRGVFVQEIERSIPPQYRDKIQYRYLTPVPNKWDPMAQIGKIAWKYSNRHTRCQATKFLDYLKHGWKTT